MSLRGRSAGDASAGAGAPAASHYSSLLRRSAPRAVLGGKSPWEYILLKRFEAKSANSLARVNIVSAMQVHWICSMCSAKGSVLSLRFGFFVFTKGNICYLNSFVVVTASSDPDFAASPGGSCRGSSRRRMINARVLPSPQKNFFENSVS